MVCQFEHGMCMYRIDSRWSMFFFQAEDGIRDYKVTGVQTCALPISAQPRDDRRVLAGEVLEQRRVRARGHDLERFDHARSGPVEERIAVGDIDPRTGTEIGRASCRERV